MSDGDPEMGIRILWAGTAGEIRYETDSTADKKRWRRADGNRKKQEEVESVVTGTFPAQRFFDTLAAILSRRENVTITVTVTQEGEKQRKAVV